MLFQEIIWDLKHIKNPGMSIEPDFLENQAFTYFLYAF